MTQQPWLVVTMFYNVNTAATPPVPVDPTEMKAGYILSFCASLHVRSWHVQTFCLVLLSGTWTWIGVVCGLVLLLIPLCVWLVCHHRWVWVSPPLLLCPSCVYVIKQVEHIHWWLYLCEGTRPFAAAAVGHFANRIYQQLSSLQLNMMQQKCSGSYPGWKCPICWISICILAHK